MKEDSFEKFSIFLDEYKEVKSAKDFLTLLKDNKSASKKGKPARKCKHCFR